MNIENPALEEDASQTEAPVEKLATWAKQKGFPGLYRQHPSGIYYIRYRLNGKRTWHSLKTKEYSQIRYIYREAMLDIEKRRIRGPVDTKLKTIGDLMTAKLLDVAESKELAPSTKHYFQVIFNRVRQNWPLDDVNKSVPSRVTREIITEFRDSLIDDELSSAVTNQILTALGGLLATAVQLRLCPENPFTDKKFTKKLFLRRRHHRVELPSRENMEKVFKMISQFEVPELLRELNNQRRIEDALNTGEHARFLAYSGMRLKEGTRCRWEDIHGERIEVNSAASAPPGNNGKAPGAPVGKSESSHRWIPIISHLAKLLDEIRARRAKDNLPLKGPILLCKQSKVALQRACRKLGLKPLRHHDLRHYFATVCIEEDVDIPTVSRWLGHADGGALCMRIYGHLRDEHSERCAAKVSFEPRNIAPAISA